MEGLVEAVLGKQQVICIQAPIFINILENTIGIALRRDLCLGSLGIISHRFLRVQTGTQFVPSSLPALV